MLSSHLGEDVFTLGVSNYLKAHAYGNATTADLWSAISEASGQDINAQMDNWIKKIGYPVVTVAEEPGQISIRQSRFLSTGDVKPEEDETVWWIPLGIKTGSKTSEATLQTLTTKEDTLRDLDTDFYKINTDNRGVFRTNYPPARLAKLGEQADKLSGEDKIGLIGDSYSLAVAGYSTTAGFLSFVAGLKNETQTL
jgi:aminopeptidase N